MPKCPNCSAPLPLSGIVGSFDMLADASAGISSVRCLYCERISVITFLAGEPELIGECYQLAGAGLRIHEEDR